MTAVRIVPIACSRASQSAVSTSGDLPPFYVAFAQLSECDIAGVAVARLFGDERTPPWNNVTGAKALYPFEEVWPD